MEKGKRLIKELEDQLKTARQQIDELENAKSEQKEMDHESRHGEDSVEGRIAEMKRHRVKISREDKFLKFTELELRKSKEKYQTILESIEDGYYEVDTSGNFILFNDSLCNILGYPKNRLIGRNLRDFDDSDNHLRGYEAFNKVFTTGIPTKEFDWEIKRKNGERRNVEASISLMRDPDNKRPIGFRGIIRDITDRRQALEALHESEEKFRVLVEESPLGISLLDADNRYEYVNPKFIEMFGYGLEDIPTGREWLRKAYPDKNYRARVIHEWLTGLKEYGIGEARPRTYDVRCKDDSIKIIHFRSVTMETGEQITFCEDITDQKNLEAQLLVAQKVESLGTLAGGMAHNFNNLLMGIQGNSSLMLLEMDDSHPHYSRLQNIEKLIQSGTKLTHQLLGYARKGKNEVRIVNLNHLLIETSDTFGIARKEIRINKELCAESCGITVDQGQIEQVLLNLYVNAADAMPKGGDLFLITSSVTSKDMTGRSYTPKKGKYVKLTVRDTGEGMDKEIMERIFDPFFTTKGQGKGTGLGLASVYGIIKAHGGYIDVDSQIGQGSTFHIYLPRSELNLNQTAKESAKIIKGMGRILIVDDESAVLEVCREYLLSLGYNVLNAKGGKEAITIFKEKRDQIDLIILDLIMPDLGGSETYDLIKSIRPDVKILLCSGYSIEGQAAEIMAKGCEGFIQKPFNMEMLSQSIHSILGASSHTPNPAS